LDPARARRGRCPCPHSAGDAACCRSIITAHRPGFLPPPPLRRTSAVVAVRGGGLFGCGLVWWTPKTSPRLSPFSSNALDLHLQKTGIRKGEME
jgi:hypothetical protein